jgi:hypothetical protein
VVQVSQTQLDNLLKRIDALEKDKDMLLQIADKKQLGIYYQRHAGKIPTRVMLRTFGRENKVVLGWRSTKDIMESETGPGGTVRWTEDQRCELLFEDGTSSGEISQKKFTRDYKQVPAEVIGKITDEETGNLALKVRRLDNGKEYTIGVQFVN